MKKLSVLVCLLFSMWMSPVAYADVVSPQQLGVIHAVIGYCKHIDPPHQSRYDLKEMRLLKGMSEKSIDQAQKSSAYLDTFALISNLLSRRASKLDDVASCLSI